MQPADEHQQHRHDDVGNPCGLGHGKRSRVQSPESRVPTTRLNSPIQKRSLRPWRAYDTTSAPRAERGCVAETSRSTSNGSMVSTDSHVWDESRPLRLVFDTAAL